METRPKIKITPSALDNRLELMSKVLLVLMWSLALYTFFKLPANIPTHFDASGQADSYGNRMTILLLPVVATIIYAGMTILNKYPWIFNYLSKITDENARQQYTIATRLFRLLKVATLLVFSIIILFTYLTTIGVTRGLGIWFLPFTIALLSVPTVISIGQSLRKF